MDSCNVDYVTAENSLKSSFGRVVLLVYLLLFFFIVKYRILQSIHYVMIQIKENSQMMQNLLAILGYGKPTKRVFSFIEFLGYYCV